ncbi:hypothetical protein RHECNPAF_280034 [Rhizobium etli CNPAF512]|nr:hypothetical protein RHECNPAF_280034 [Rhizobium etli CNPAF512]
MPAGLYPRYPGRSRQGRHQRKRYPGNRGRMLFRLGLSRRGTFLSPRRLTQNGALRVISVLVASQSAASFVVETLLNY